ncbi:MAG TPA: hypothetical protein PLI95_24725, partial [Polyangiaceae bacterium]|nr:hypothetical protein [Polyangiaceae bacterium]
AAVFQDIRAEMREHGHQHVHFVGDKNEIANVLENIVRPGDVVIAQGAGDINKSVRELHDRLRRKQGDG